jgi:hypothetical protein
MNSPPDISGKLPEIIMPKSVDVFGKYAIIVITI